MRCIAAEGAAMTYYARRAKVAKVGDVVVAPGVGLECAC
jgi:hypothetical protein